MTDITSMFYLSVHLRVQLELSRDGSDTRLVLDLFSLYRCKIKVKLSPESNRGFICD